METLPQPLLREQTLIDRIRSQAQNKSSKRNSSSTTRGRDARLNSFYASGRSSRSLDRLTFASETTTAFNAFRAANIKRWDGNRRTTTKWDDLRKVGRSGMQPRPVPGPANTVTIQDNELWFPDGDCLVHFYGLGQSKRGPSLRLHLADIESSKCGPLLQRFNCRSQRGTPSPSSIDSGVALEPPSQFSQGELYIPAPSHLSREETFQYHLTTRNFFAWIYERPLVGDRLGGALIALLERMNNFRSKDEENQNDILAYIDGQEYCDFRECPDHALAVLQFAEKFELRELWTDAFVHCAGMNNDLASSAEFEVSITRTVKLHYLMSAQFTSRTSKALITRAHLEMDLRLEHAGRALGTFLEDELSGACLGLGQDARAHLERFRSFLHSFYVQKYGYWPPPQPKRYCNTLPKSTYQAMYFEIRNLYEYLVDPHSGDSFQIDRPLDGGICVLQNIKAFDSRHRYTSLPHALPLLPVQMAGPKAHGLARLFGSKQAKINRRAASSAALFRATNAGDMTVLDCGLVRQYIKFEMTCSMKEEERITCSDARKVRWILVYAMLQTLVSVTRAPKEVRDTEGVSYSLCCQIAGTPPWTVGTTSQPSDSVQHEPTVKQSDHAVEIKPDTDWSALKPHPLATRATPTPAISLPHKVSFSHALSVESPQPQKAGLCEMLLQGYEVIAIPQHVDSHPSTPSSSEEEGSGWDTSSDEDAMEHASVTGSASFYGDDEGLARPYHQETNNSMALAKKYSISSFHPGSLNPEVEGYIKS